MTPGPSAASQEQWDAVVERLDDALVLLDFDGTLAPIVDDPAQAHVHPDGPGVLAALARRVRAVALVTGRPADQVVSLGRLGEVADDIGARGRLLVRGQYGAERWDSATRRVESPEPPAGVEELRSRLPGLLDDAGLDAAHVEDKGLALAVHTRRLPDAAQAAERVAEVLGPVAAELDLVLEPGRMVVEVRAPGMDKGGAVRDLVAQLEPGALVYVGDDLGDLPGLRAVEDLRGPDLPGLLVCSGSTEQQALVEHTDLVVDGPDGVMDLLRRLAETPGS